MKDWPREITSGRTGGRKAWRWVEAFVKEIRQALGARAIGRSVIEDGEQRLLRDLQQPYNVHFKREKARLNQNSGLKWNVFPEI